MAFWNDVRFAHRQLHKSPGFVFTVLATLATYSNLNAASGYALKSMNMNAYIGQTVQIRFVGREDVSLATSFVIDDITLTVQ